MKRRNFLKSLGAAAVAGALPGAALAATEVPAAAEGTGGQPLATLFDLSICEGCGACVDACHVANAHKYPEPEKPFPKMSPARVKVEDWSDKRGVDDRLTPYNWLYVEHLEVSHGGREHEIHMPRRCMHCVNPPCVDLCPWGACTSENNGAVSIDSDICLGGAKCRKVCPWHIPQRQTGVGLYLDLMPRFAGNGVMYKCDRCKERLAEGEVPACIEACPVGAQIIGPRDEIIAKAHALAEEMGGYIYGEHENGGTNTIYVSPVPFETLAHAHERGPGRPTLKRVGDAMAGEEARFSALALAPVAGLAAGVLRSVSNHKNKAKESDHADDK